MVRLGCMVIRWISITRYRFAPSVMKESLGACVSEVHQLLSPARSNGVSFGIQVGRENLFYCRKGTAAAESYMRFFVIEIPHRGNVMNKPAIVGVREWSPT